MQTINERPSTETRQRLEALVEALPFGERIPRHSGDMAFDKAWEIRAFAMTVALHDKFGFPWGEFQQELIAAIHTWEAQQPDSHQWSYYERWMVALEELACTKGWMSQVELDTRTEEILALPPNANHQHATREPVNVVTGVTAS